MPKAGENDNRERVLSAALDEAGSVRNHPEICQICHGGSIPASFPADVAAVDTLFDTDLAAVDTIIDHFTTSDPSTFREFDLQAFRNVQGSQPNNDAKQLNCDYVLDSAPYVAVNDLIIGWYGDDLAGAGEDCDGTSNANVNQPDYVPPAWLVTAGDEDIYTNVMARVCRTCHVAQKNLDFTDPAAAGFGWNAAHAALPYTCNLGVAMPC